MKSPTSADGVYILVIDAPIANAPPDFLAELERPAEKVTTGAVVSLSLAEDFKLECQTADPAIEGQAGDATTYKLACRGYDMGLPLDLVYQHMRDEWNPRCVPPWSDADLYQKVKNAFRYAKNSAGNRTPEAVFSPEMVEEPPVMSPPPGKEPPSNVVDMSTYKDDQILQALRPDMLQVDSKGNPTSVLANIACILKVDPAWRGKIRYNQFSSTLEFTERPPWRKNQLNIGMAIDQRDVDCMLVWFSSRRLEVPQNKLIHALQAVAEPVHPVKQYLESLVWDGVPRLNKILIDTAGAADDPLNRDIGRCLLIGAVRRIYEPGCKHDDVPILEGPQGTRKSMWIQVLAGEFGATGQLVRGDKDTYQNLRGRWIVELPEINSTFSKVDANWLKGVISTAVDTYRPSYAHAASQFPRESVFVGTINPNATREYLKDDENRRYLPVPTGKINIELLKELRDQYFAEAYHRYKLGEPAWITDPIILQMAKARQESRREKDPLVEILRDCNFLYRPEGCTPREVYQALGYVAKDIKSHERKRVYAAMTELGFEYVQPEFGGGRWKKTRTTWSDLL
jgi:predicted P-loop ATPase